MPDVLDRLQAAITDRYVLGRELGRGGMATVYLAQDLKHDRPVAIKACCLERTLHWVMATRRRWRSEPPLPS